MIRSTFAGITTAYSALQANQKRLDIVGQNLSNMYTTGYTRQQLDTSSMNYTNPVSHYMNKHSLSVGFGAKMERISQIRDPYLDVQYRDQIAKASYNDAMQTSLDTLSTIFDETNIEGMAQSLLNIQSALTTMQDPSKVNNPIYESQLQVLMQSFTNLLNDAARQIEAAEVTEYHYLDGTGTSEQGAIQQVNSLLQQIGDLNIRIKENEVFGQESLELLDKRNVLLDELASYIPIEVSYYNEEKWEDWPDDLKVDLVYTDDTGAKQRLTLVDGTKGGIGNNYGSLAITTDPNGVPTSSAANPTAASITFTAAKGENTTADRIDVAAGSSYFSTGSIQSSLDMLGKTFAGGDDTVRGFQYYMGELNSLAKAFADEFNNINDTVYGAGALLQYDDDDTAAATIRISDDWVNGTTHIAVGTDPDKDVNEAILDMIAVMSKPLDDLEDNSFSDFLNHISTVLANDSSINKTAMETNTTVLNGIQDSRDSVSAVSMDEEASNMMVYLNAYNAASRLLTALDQALDTLINNTGVVGR